MAIPDIEIRVFVAGEERAVAAFFYIGVGVVETVVGIDDPGDAPAVSGALAAASDAFGAADFKTVAGVDQEVGPGVSRADDPPFEGGQKRGNVGDASSIDDIPF